MNRFDMGELQLAQEISAMTEAEVCQFIRSASRTGRLSKAVRSLNRDALSEDFERRRRAQAAIRKLGFI